MGRPRRRSGTSGPYRRRWTGRAAARAAAGHGAGPFHRRGLRAGRGRTGRAPCRQRRMGRWSGSGSTTVRWPPRSSASAICGSTGVRRPISPRCPGSGGRPTAGSAPTPTTRTTGPGCSPLSACPPIPAWTPWRGARRAAGCGDRGDGVRRGRSGRRTAYPGGVGGARAGRRNRHTPAADARPDRGAGAGGCTPPSRRVGFAAAARRRTPGSRHDPCPGRSGGHPHAGAAGRGRPADRCAAAAGEPGRPQRHGVRQTVGLAGSGRPGGPGDVRRAAHRRRCAGHRIPAGRAGGVRPDAGGARRTPSRSGPCSGVRVGAVRAVARTARLRQSGAGGHRDRGRGGGGRDAGRTARTGPRPRHRLSAGGGRAACADRAARGRRFAVAAAGTRADGALALRRPHAHPGPVRPVGDVRPLGDVRPREASRLHGQRAGPASRYALPPVSFAGGPADWSRPPGRLGADAPKWRTTTA